MRPQRRSFKPKHYVFSALQSYKKVLSYVSRVLRLYGSQAWKQACLHWTCQSFRSVEDGHYTEEAEGHHLKDYFKHDRERALWRRAREVQHDGAGSPKSVGDRYMLGFTPAQIFFPWVKFGADSTKSPLDETMKWSPPCRVKAQSSGAVWKSRWPSWAARL